MSVVICLLISVSTIDGASGAVSQSDQYAEKFHFVCDKDVYCVQENVRFRLINIDQKSEYQLSNIVYVDIVTPQGLPVVQGKYQLYPEGASGNILIPENVQTGNYYIRFYTKWMRDGQMTSFFFKPLRIINAFSSNVLQHEKRFNVNEQSLIDTIQIPTLQVNALQTISVESNQVVSLDISKHIQAYNINNASVSITKKGSVFHPYVYEYKNPNPGITIIPETRGLSLSGTIVNKQDSIPIPNVGVWVSMPLNDQIIKREVFTNRKGKFHVDLGKEYGSSELYIHPQVTQSDLSPLVLTDNDFAYAMVSLPYLTFQPDRIEEKWYREMAVNSQLHNLYHLTSADSVSLVNTSEMDYNFYGKPDFVLTIDDFISLPAIEDYIKELMPMIKIKGNKQNTFMQVLGKSDNYLNSDPLVMYNSYKISDLKSILELTPHHLERIEVVQGLYVRGDITYGGIVHFIPKTGVHAKINLDDKSIILPYRLFNTEMQVVDIYKNEPHVPHVGNCLYWNPSIDISKSGTGIIHFNTGSEPGTLQLKIEGIDRNNKPFIYLSDIEVN
jgi:hypothetical protein